MSEGNGVNWDFMGVWFDNKNIKNVDLLLVIFLF